MKTKVVNISDIKNAIHLQGPLGTLAASAVMKILGLDRLNALYAEISEATGREFTGRLLEKMDIRYDLNPKELENIPRTGPFILVSNHPFGGIDGIILFHIVSSIRPDFKILTNFLLSRIDNLKDYFLPVNPFSEMKGRRKSLAGLRAARNLLAEGGCLGLFPAGEVSAAYRRRTIEDKEWSSSMTKLIRSSKVPVIPVYFDGYNSERFYRLGRINPWLRTVRLPRELLNKAGRTVPMRIGKPVTVSEMEEYANDREFGHYLRSRVYAMEANVSRPRTREEILPGDSVPVALPRDLQSMLREIGILEAEGHHLFDTANYACYLAPYELIPNLMHEIGRLREEAFRRAGEGTNKELDLDEYDKTYRHLILWDKSGRRIAGAYRLGIGRDIFPAAGVKGFYSDTLFAYRSPEADGFLPYAIELGRSFVANDYQREALPLMLLIKGLMFSVIKYPDCRYLIGPVSISDWYPEFYKSLMVHYALHRHGDSSLARMIRPRNPYRPDFLRCDPQALLGRKSDTVEKFDRFLLRLSDNAYRLPTLVKKYIKLNCRFLAFNVDKDFNNCLDGLIILDLKDVPREEIEALAKDRPDREEILARFGFS